jgi:hypothetical protein
MSAIGFYNHFVNSNLGRVCGINTLNSSSSSNKNEVAKKISFISSFFLKSEWSQWFSAVKACCIGNFAKAWKVESSSMRLNHSNVKCYTLSYDKKDEIQAFFNRIKEWKAEAYSNKDKYKENPVWEDSAHAVDDLMTGLRYLQYTDIAVEIFEYKSNEEVYGLGLVHRYKDSGHSCLFSLVRNPSFVEKEKAHKVGTSIISKILENSIDRGDVESFDFSSRRSALGFYEHLGFEFPDKSGFSPSSKKVHSIKIQQLFCDIQQKLSLTSASS